MIRESVRWAENRQIVKMPRIRPCRWHPWRGRFTLPPTYQPESTGLSLISSLA